MSGQWELLPDDPVAAARRLLGCRLVREQDGHQLIGKIVETEAYEQTDAASHSFRGRTARTDVMFGPPGHLYVYFTYGMHYCCNVVVGQEGYGAAVLIRALEPISGQERMSLNRGGLIGHTLANGPGKLCQALAIDKALNGHDLTKSPLRLEMAEPLADSQIVTATRVGITRDVDKPWRFYVRDNPYFSKK